MQEEIAFFDIKKILHNKSVLALRYFLPFLDNGFTLLSENMAKIYFLTLIYQMKVASTIDLPCCCFFSPPFLML